MCLDTGLNLSDFLSGLSALQAEGMACTRQRNLVARRHLMESVLVFAAYQLMLGSRELNQPAQVVKETLYHSDTDIFLPLSQREIKCCFQKEIRCEREKQWKMNNTEHRETPLFFSYSAGFPSLPLATSYSLGLLPPPPSTVV